MAANRFGLFNFRGEKMNDQLSIYDGNEKTMTIKQISEVLGVSESTVQRYIKKVFPEKIENGIQTFLSEREVTAIKLKMQQNQHLTRSAELPKTDLEKELLIQQAMQLQAEKIQILQSRLEEAKPKVEFYDQVGDCEGLHTVAEAAKMLGTGRNKLFSWMRMHKILRDNNEPYQRYVNAGHFEVKENPYNDHIKAQTFVTPTGLQWLQKRREKNLVQVTEWVKGEYGIELSKK